MDISQSSDVAARGSSRRRFYFAMATLAKTYETSPLRWQTRQDGILLGKGSRGREKSLGFLVSWLLELLQKGVVLVPAA
jgi:hypothetical protein